ncbi:MAG: class I SAM-dependent RNA methyltransferase [Erythrobacter sp.]|jgi:23S rRNA (uracil1939-C5)-methyltransferase|nr:class I SAM-dependent RNA methyltransferase [Erythrobacter sp.]
MTERETIVRIAAKGDGVTATGRHVAGAVPGDTIEANGQIICGPHHADPPCRHFGTCGGCVLQHADERALAQFVKGRVLGAAQGQGLEPREVLDTHLCAAGTRRRATLHAVRTAKGAMLGYREAGSHRIVDMRECHVLVPELVALVPALRAFLGARGGKGAIDVQLTLSDQGCDVALSNLRLEGLRETEATLDFARENGLARLSIDQGFGPETVWEPEPVTVTLSNCPVPLPVGAFLQATIDAETRMTADAQRWAGEAKTVLDLFAGLGTFAFALAGRAKVLAAEADRAAHLACATAARTAGASVFAQHRDLFRNPYQPAELDRFDAVLLDPPRAGARTQVAELAKSTVSRVIYISCNPSSWARDAALLRDAGFALAQLRPVGQFRWSTHVELTSVFER